MVVLLVAILPVVVLAFAVEDDEVLYVEVESVVRVVVMVDVVVVDVVDDFVHVVVVLVDVVVKTVVSLAPVTYVGRVYKVVGKTFKLYFVKKMQFLSVLQNM